MWECRFVILNSRISTRTKTDRKLFVKYNNNSYHTIYNLLWKIFIIIFKQNFIHSWFKNKQTVVQSISQLRNGANFTSPLVTRHNSSSWAHCCSNTSVFSVILWKQNSSLSLAFTSYLHRVTGSRVGPPCSLSLRVQWIDEINGFWLRQLKSLGVGTFCFFHFLKNNSTNKNRGSKQDTKHVKMG